MVGPSNQFSDHTFYGKSTLKLFSSRFLWAKYFVLIKFSKFGLWNITQGLFTFWGFLAQNSFLLHDNNCLMVNFMNIMNILPSFLKLLPLLLLKQGKLWWCHNKIIHLGHLPNIENIDGYLIIFCLENICWNVNNRLQRKKIRSSHNQVGFAVKRK